MRHTTTLILALLPVTGCFDPGTPMDELPAETDGMETDAMGGSSGSTGSTSTANDGSTTDPSTSSTSSSSTSSTSSPAGSSSSETGDNDQPIDFEDEFDADQGLWTFTDDPGAVQEGPGSWSYVAGDLVQTSDISGPDGESPTTGTYALGGDFDWDSYAVEVGFTADDDGVAGVLCHTTAGGGFVRFELDHETGIAMLVQRTGAGTVILAEAEAFTPPVPLGVERTLRLVCGATYEGYIDNQLAVQAPGNAEAEGGIGMYSSSIGDGPQGLRFHWIEID